MLSYHYPRTTYRYAYRHLTTENTKSINTKNETEYYVTYCQRMLSFNSDEHTKPTVTSRTYFSFIFQLLQSNTIFINVKTFRYFYKYICITYVQIACLTLAGIRASWQAFPLKTISIDVAHMSHSVNTKLSRHSPLKEHHQLTPIFKQWIDSSSSSHTNVRNMKCLRPMEITFTHSTRNLIRFYWLSSRWVPFRVTYMISPYSALCVHILFKLNWIDEIDIGDSGVGEVQTVFFSYVRSFVRF